MERHYYRCRDCLTVSAIDDKSIFAFSPVPVCGICGGRIDHMGRVEQTRLVNDSMRTPCDGRCTGASGPHCDCKCGGANHGTQRLVYVITDAGDIPRLSPCGTEQEREQAMQRAAEWRELYNEAIAVLATFPRGWLPERQFRNKLSLERALREARKARVHKTRMGKLAESIRKLNGEIYDKNS